MANAVCPQVKVGDHFKYTFGYDMTIVQFYRVMRRTDKTVWLQEVPREVRDDYGFGNGRAWPAEDAEPKEGAPVFQARLKEWGGEPMLNVARKGYMRLWDGKPCYYNTWD